MEFADGSSIRWYVATGRKSPAGTAVYDTARYDQDTYDGSTDVVWLDFSEKALSLRIKRGKDAFLRRFRTGTCQIVFDNQTSEFTDTRFLPGDLVWVVARKYTPAGLPPTPIPDGTDWDGSETGRPWESHGNDLILQGDPATYEGFSLFFGRVASSQDIVKGGVDVTRVNCTDMFADLAVAEFSPSPPAGGGESAGSRVNRIISNVGQGFTAGAWWPTVSTMQPTELAGKALDELQLTIDDSEGGAIWALPYPNAFNSGAVQYAGRDWLTEAPKSTEVQWTLGGVTLPLIDGVIHKAVQLIVNDATFASVGGIEQQATSPGSIQRYGLRTFRKTDLICEGDAQPAFLAGRVIHNLNLSRPRVREAAVNVETGYQADFGCQVQFGDLVNVGVNSINWARTFQAHVFGIQHTVSPSEWEVTLTLDDAFVDNVDGPFSHLEFSDSFSLGGHP